MWNTLLKSVIKQDCINSKYSSIKVLWYIIMADSDKANKRQAGNPPDSVTGFKTIETIGKLVVLVIQRFWRLCSAAMLTLLLLYWLYGGITTFLLLTAAVLGVLYFYQDALLYFPDQPESSRVFVQTPHKFGLPFENFYLKTRDGIRINVMLIKQPSPRLAVAPTVLFFHGNAGNIGHRLINSHALYKNCGCNVFLVEYRGYGRSDGSPSERGEFTETLCFPFTVDFRTVTLFLAIANACSR